MFRIPVGLMADRIGARLTAIIGLCVTFVPLLLGWLWVDSYATMLPVGLLLGVAGASFAAALPLASRWYPPQYQGLAMGIAGAGNSGTVLAAFFAPRIAQAWGWHAVFGLAILPIFLTLLVVVLLAKDSPTQPAPQPMSAYAAVFRLRDTWWFCFFYAITFGGFVGLASFLNTYFHDQYGLTAAQAGSYAALCVFSGSLLRPVGGYLADHFGGLRVLMLLYVGAGLMLLGLSTTPSLNAATMLMFIGMGMSGDGQWIGVSISSPTLCQTDWHHHGRGRRRRWIRRVRPPHAAKRREAIHRQLRHGTVGIRFRGFCRSDRSPVRRGALGASILGQGRPSRERASQPRLLNCIWNSKRR